MKGEKTDHPLVLRVISPEIPPEAIILGCFFYYSYRGACSRTTLASLRYCKLLPILHTILFPQKNNCNIRKPVQYYPSHVALFYVVFGGWDGGSGPFEAPGPRPPIIHPWHLSLVRACQQLSASKPFSVHLLKSPYVYVSAIMLMCDSSMRVANNCFDPSQDEELPHWCCRHDLFFFLKGFLCLY